MLLDQPIHSLTQLLHQGQLDPTACVAEAYKQITKWQPKTNALVSIIDQDLAYGRAKNAVTRKLPLSGIPFVLKDSYVTNDSKTSAASAVLTGYQGQYNATVYQKLLSAGAILVGKGNMDAWGHGASSENNDTGPVKNPYDLKRTAGGSSGGCAVAVATRMCAFAIGEDTGGSIRNPAAWNNLTGLKVTYGRVSRYGCIAYASSFDTVGPMAKTAIDCSLVLSHIAGPDPYDATSSPQPPPNHQTIKKPLKSLIIGLPNNLLEYKALDNDIKNHLLEFAQQLKKLGHRILSLDLPSLDFSLPVYYIISPSETSSNLARYDGIRYGQDRSHFTQESMRRLMIGTFALSAGYYDAYYLKAQKARTLLIKEFHEAFQKTDCLLMPTTPINPPNFGTLVKDPITNMLTDVYTIPQNIAGLASLSLPVGFSKLGLPIGIQLTGPMFSESMLLNLAHQYQAVSNSHLESPHL